MEIYLHAQKYYWENFKVSDRKFQFWILKIIVFLADIAYLVKPLSNHKAVLNLENVENIGNFEGWRLTVVAYKNESIVEAKRKFLN